MRALVIREYAHPSKIPLDLNAPEPVLKPNQVLVDVHSAGLNFFDILQTQGKYQNQPPFPFVAGAEFAGRISAVPEKGCQFKLGDRVFGYGQGAYADRIAVDPKELLPIPSGMTYRQACGLYVTWPTSYEALVGRAKLQSGETCLVHGGAGGVGMAAIQIAKALGATVIATAGSPSKLEVCIKHGGADHAVDYTKKDWQKEVLKLTNGKGVDVVYDPVGVIRDSLKCIAWSGRALVVGFAGGGIEKLPLNLVLLKNISIVGVHWGAYTKNEPSRAKVVMQELLTLLGSGTLRPVIYPEIYTLERIADGLDALEKRQTWGKAVITVREEDDARAKL